MQDLPTAYVQATRAREDNTIYATTDVADLFLEDIADSSLAQAMSRVPDLSLAADFLPAGQTSSSRQELFSRVSSKSTSLN